MRDLVPTCRLLRREVKKYRRIEESKASVVNVDDAK